MLTKEIAEYLGSTVAGLSVGTNVWAVPVPETAPGDIQVSVVEYAGRAPLRAMGPSLGDPVAEIARFQVAVIGQLSQYLESRQLIEEIRQALDQLTEATLGGTRYLLVRELQPPFYQPPGEIGDPNAQHHFSINFEALRERN